MIFWILFALAIVSAILLLIDTVNCNIPIPVLIISVVYLGLWLLFHIIFIPAVLYEGSDINKADMQIKYEQLEENKNNPFLVNDIVEWNETIQLKQKYQKNFWIGPYIANIYDDYKTIQVNE